MDEPTIILGMSINELFSMLKTIAIVVTITALITIQFLKIRYYKNLIKNLSAAFGINELKNKSENELVEKIIRIHLNGETSKIKVHEKISNFILNQLYATKVYIHFTSKESFAKTILTEGFKYSESIYKTTQEVVNNSVDLTYKLQIYRPYGNYLIVICIQEKLFEFANKYVKSNKHFSLIDNVLSVYNPNDDLEYTLPAKFIRGYIDMEKSTIVENKSFLNDINPEIYKTRILEYLS